MQKLLKLIWLLFMSFNSSGQYSVYVKTFFDGSPYEEQGRAVKSTSNNNLIITGMTFQTGSTFNVLTMLVDSAGQIIWNNNYGGQYYDQGKAVAVDNNNNILISGETSQGSLGKGLMLLKLDENGNIIWDKAFGLPNSEGYSNSIMTDGSYLLSGYSNGSNNIDRNFYAVKTDTAGAIIWSKTFGSSGSEECTGSFETYDNSIILCGFTDGIGAGSDDILVVKLNYLGDTIWVKTFGNSGGDYCYGGFETNDLNYMLYGVIDGKASAIKIDEDGNIIWAKSYAMGWFNSAKQTINGNISFSGSTLAFTPGDRNFYLLNTDENGTIINSKIYGQLYNDECFGIEIDNELNIILVGSSSNSSNGDIYLIKTNNFGNGAGCNESNVVSTITMPSIISISQQLNVSNYGSSYNLNFLPYGSLSENLLCSGISSNLIDQNINNQVAIHPLPASDVLNIYLYENNYYECEYTISDINGKAHINGTITNKISEIDVKSLNAGLYFIQLNFDNYHSINKKFIITR